jgi:hypothetical protein
MGIYFNPKWVFSLALDIQEDLNLSLSLVLDIIMHITNKKTYQMKKVEYL